MEVRLATEDDVDFMIDSAVTLAFDTEGKQLDRDIVRSGMIHCLQDNALGCYYVALLNGTRVGTTMLTYEMSLEKGGQIHWI